MVRVDRGYCCKCFLVTSTLHRGKFWSPHDAQAQLHAAMGPTETRWMVTRHCSSQPRYGESVVPRRPCGPTSTARMRYSLTSTLSPRHRPSVPCAQQPACYRGWVRNAALRGPPCISRRAGYVAPARRGLKDMAMSSNVREPRVATGRLLLVMCSAAASQGAGIRIVPLGDYLLQRRVRKRRHPKGACGTDGAQPHGPTLTLHLLQGGSHARPATFARRQAARLKMK